MATLYITEVEKVNQTLVDGQVVMSPQMPPIAEQHLAIGIASAPSAAWQKETRFVMVHTDAVCSLAWSNPGDAAPTAVPTAHRFGQNETRFYGVTPGGQLAVIVNT
jgi:hypothetical protein